MLDQPEIEALYIATPNSTHIPIALSAIEAGKHVLIEKPLGLSLNNASQLCEYDGRGIEIAVAFKKRFGSAVQYMRQILDTSYLQSRVFYKWHISKPPSGWRYDSKISGGGVVMDLGSHIFDLFEYLFGSIEEVEAWVSMSNKAADIEDTARISLRFRSGTEGLVDLSWTSEATCQQLGVKLGGGDVTVERVSPHQDILSIYNPSETLEYRFDPASEYEGLLSEFCDMIMTGSGNIPTLDVGLRNQVVIEAVYKSAAECCPVLIS
jgi:predicted dehydrogenase